MIWVWVFGAAAFIVIAIFVVALILNFPGDLL